MRSISFRTSWTIELVAAANPRRVEREGLEPFDALPMGVLDTPALAYWHDMGHGQVRANLGLIRHAEAARKTRRP